MVTCPGRRVGHQRRTHNAPQSVGAHQRVTHSWRPLRYRYLYADLLDIDGDDTTVGRQVDGQIL
jgi:hypothetical protein